MATYYHKIFKLYLLICISICLVLLTKISEIHAQQQPQQQQQQLEQPQIANRQSALTPGADDEYLVGFGIADITGPSADINLMGYAKPNQDAGGIHLRQFCRSLVMEDYLGTRLVYISLDNGMVSQLLRTRLMKRLQDEFGGIYNESNVMISATHTHSGPGGYFQYLLYNIPSAGYIAQTLEALVDGISRCVWRAHEQVQPAKLYYHKGELLDASINRSPTSYANNPAEERQQYEHNTDKAMFLVRAVDLRGEPLGMVNWFAVHGTSMNNTNHLISSDNKGYAALLFEQEFNSNLNNNASNTGWLPGQGKFVAMFAQANEGDVSPNTRGPRCIDTGLPCDLATSTCGNPPRNEKCIAFGPGKDMFESTKIIAYKQYYKARELFLDTTRQRPIRGPLRYVHEYIDVTKQQVPEYRSMVELARRHQQEEEAANEKTCSGTPDCLAKRSPKVANGRRQDHHEHRRQLQPSGPINNGTNGQSPGYYTTCVAALGYSFAAGTTDGPGAFDFQQGDTASSRYWNLVRNFLRKPSDEQVKCHHPKPILLSTGEMDFPYMWHPKVVPTQIFMLGDRVAIVGLPGEFTTMSGRRVRRAVQAALAGKNSNNDANADANQKQHDLASDETASTSGQRGEQRDEAQFEVVLSGLSNIYTSYVTTVEEYEVQRYEGASTLYGPHTLQAYVNQFIRMARVLASTPKTSSYELTQAGLQPPDLTKSLFTLKAGVIFDGAPHGKSFGDLLQDVEPGHIYRCRDLVSASFVAGNPRNDLKQEQSFLYVDKFNPNERTWTPVASDASWETKFIWDRTNTLFGESKATIQWEIPDQCETGVYRLRHLGAHKNLLQTIGHYEGKSTPFKVLAARTTTTSGSEQLDQAETTSNSSNWLEAVFRLAQQVEARPDGNNGTKQLVASQLPASPKSDQRARQSNSVIGTLFNRLGSMFQRRQ